ncbi:MAG TPA: MFS transporter, partial [Acidimicrobiaceae bacterium]|nr:MFS transporter [Acidimicrobiaceae bacterium]
MSRTASQSPAKTKRRAESAQIDGRGGWVVVGATCLSTFAVFGVAYSFGAFFTAIRDEFDVGNSAVSLFFAITTFVYFVLGVVTGRLADRFGPRPVLLVGAVVMVAALLATSRVTNVWLGYVTYGLGVGIGIACAYVPMVATVGAWFERRRTTALGVAVAGIGIGTLVGSPSAKALVNAHGWRTAYVVLAVVAGALMLLASLGARRPPRPADAAPLPALSGLISNGRFALLYVAMMLLSAALFVPFVYLDDYVERRGATGGALLIGIIGAMSVVGRLGFGALGSRFSLLRLYQLSFATLGGSYLIWLWAGGDFSRLVAFAAVIGVGYGGFIALSPAVAAQLFGPAGLGGVLGALYTAAGIGGLLGPPLTGLLIDGAGYDWTIVAAMAVALAAVPLLVAVEVLGRRHAAGPAGAAPAR